MTSSSIRTLLSAAGVIPVLTVERVVDAAPLAKALAAGGLTVLEVTLRTAAALDVIRTMKSIAGLSIGVGTVVSASDVTNAAEAGCDFIVTPGLSRSTIEAAHRAGIPILPGVATPTEIMAGLDLGLDTFKFFPAEPSGGLPMLAAFEGPFQSVRFCPTGGIRHDQAAAYLGRPNVIAVGGGWVAPSDLIKSGSWTEITHLAQTAAALRNL
jgi:2-dehydro-3-deoxyphosphogluconate aldolase/(4S)-4-hydroxy-2-oxoglutarate aldolase